MRLLSQAGVDVLVERRRQKTDEGWTAEHDDGHDYGEMAKAAACYALASRAGNPWIQEFIEHHWPWQRSSWKPGDQRRNLVKAAALCIAEIERLDRAAARKAVADTKAQGGE